VTDHSNASARGRAPDSEESRLRGRLAADTARERYEAALGLVGRAEAGLDARTITALASRLREDPDADVRQFAAEALGVAGADPAALDPALDDEDEWVRAEAVVALSRAAGGDAADRLRAALDDDAGPVRRNALIALSKTGAVRTTELRERLKEDPHEPVREYAARWLGERPGDEGEAVRLLAAVLARDPAAFVRANAATGLGRLGTDRAVEALETQGLEDRSNDVQRAAKRALATARGEDPDRVDLDDPPAPGGGPTTPRETQQGRPGGLQSNATRRTRRGDPGSGARPSRNGGCDR
jgi:HEAT repeat protein